MHIERHYLDVKNPDAQHLTTDPVKLAVRVHRGARDPESSPLPAILLCHGFCCIQDVLLPAFVRLFADAGYRVVTFDYRGFGDSDGEVGRIVPEEQIDDIITVYEWCKTHPGIDGRRIALWGTSLGGSHVIEVAARRPDVKCVISQLAFADGEQLVTGDMGAEEKSRFTATMARMAAKKKQTARELFVPIIKVMTDEESRVFFERQKQTYQALDIKIPYLTVWETMCYRPINAAPRVTQPTFMVFAEQDKVIALEYGLALYEAIKAVKGCHIQPKARHYEVFAGDHLDQISERQLHWLREYL